MSRNRLNINDYQNASDDFKKDVAFANRVLEGVYNKLNANPELEAAYKDKIGQHFVHGAENVFKGEQQ